MEESTTSINELPSDPVNGGNVNMQFGEKPAMSGDNTDASQSAMALDQTTINQIVNGLQQASSSGVTQLQSRDISQSTSAIVQDPEIQPNYIPSVKNQDYISAEEDEEDIIHNYERSQERSNSLDQMYDELQIPLMIGVLYFLFQLPIVKSMMAKHIPALFSVDGNVNLYGYIFTSTLFSLIYYSISKTVTHFSKF